MEQIAMLMGEVYAKLSSEKVLQEVTGMGKEKKKPGDAQYVHDNVDPKLWYIHGNTYDLNEYVPKHPGGELAILSARGRDCTALFETYHPWNENNRKLLARYGAKPPPCEPLYQDMKEGIRKLFPKGCKETKMRPWTVFCLVAIQCLQCYLLFYVKTYVSCMLSGVLLGFFSTRLTHEPGHMQASHKPWVNRLLLWFGYLTLAPSLCWYYRHVISHHPHTNNDHDVDVVGVPLLDALPQRFNWVKVLSIPFLFTLAPYGIGIGTLFEMFAFRNLAHNYVCLTIGGLIPETIAFFVIHYLFGPSLFCYLCFWFVGGGIFVIFSQIAHVVLFPDASPAKGWAENQLRTSVNFAPRDPLWYHLAFGLTTQIDHHLFPGIGAHCLDDIHDFVVKPVCKKHGVPVYEVSGPKALSMLWQRFMTGKPVPMD